MIHKKEASFELTFIPLHPNIDMNILHTILYTFPLVLTKRICFTIRGFLHWLLFPSFLLSLHLIEG